MSEAGTVESNGALGPLRVLQERGPFLLCVETAGLERVVLTTAPELNSESLRRRLETIAEAHERIHDERVPRVSALGENGNRAYLAFACSAVTDLSRVIARVQETGQRIDYSEGIVFIEAMLEALEAAHAARITIGALSLKNVVVDKERRLHLLGFGDNVLALDENRAPLGFSDVCVAPDVAAGAPTSSGADLYACTLVVRQLIPFVVLPPRVERVLTGRVEPEDYELFQLFAWCNLAILASHPDKRPQVSEALTMERRAWALLGVQPNRDGFRALLGNCDAPLELRTDDDASYVAVAGSAPKPLGTRRALRRILSALVERHGTRPDVPLSVHELAEAGWPGESLLTEAAKNRVYVALSSLRKLGLELLIERHDGGWRLAPTATVRIE